MDNDSVLGFADDNSGALEDDLLLVLEVANGATDNDCGVDDGLVLDFMLDVREDDDAVDDEYVLDESLVLDFILDI